ELAAARAGKPHCVVICAEHDKVWMEEELRAKIGRRGQLRSMRLVVRSGDTTDPDMLSQVAIEQARAIVTLAPETASGDTHVLRALLAIGRTHTEPGRQQHVVTELADPRNLAVARLTGERRIEAL